ncbi:hypothetical protein LEMLEM_LOCUS13318 [Lemmus lemmus]
MAKAGIGLMNADQQGTEKVEDECRSIAEESRVAFHDISCFYYFYSFGSCLFCTSYLLR